MHINKNIFTKSGLMLGFGEDINEVMKVLDDLRAVDVDFLTIGQYLQPTKNHLKVDRYVENEEFIYYKEIGIEIGFKVVESGSLVRSSYHADEQARLAFVTK